LADKAKTNKINLLSADNITVEQITSNQVCYPEGEQLTAHGIIRNVLAAEGDGELKIFSSDVEGHSITVQNGANKIVILTCEVEQDVDATALLEEVSTAEILAGNACFTYSEQARAFAILVERFGAEKVQATDVTGRSIQVLLNETWQDILTCH
jgi:hypothetical protein